MIPRVPRAARATSLLILAVVGCAGSAGAPAAGVEPVAGSVAPSSPAPNAADVHFMSGMIPHHAQAVLIAGWAATHGAGDAIRRLCERIVVGQQDEIALMQNWLRDQNQPAPEANATHLRMTMNGGAHDMLMPGMLNPGELARLDRARGTEFDRLFLQAMIRHHEGAISMVDQLFASQGAGQDEVVFRFASDVYADQTTEIERMQKMLAAFP
jgi:uncharacterized protein (DUF305 family)